MLSYLDLAFMIDRVVNFQLVILYDERDDFDFHIVDFPFLSSNIIWLFFWCTNFVAHNMQHGAAHVMIIMYVTWLIDDCCRKATKSSSFGSHLRKFMAVMISLRNIRGQ